MMDYQPISQRSWSARIERWNSPKTKPADRRRLAEVCRTAGHHLFRSPVGAIWCGRCCQYFRGNDE